MDCFRLRLRNDDAAIFETASLKKLKNGFREFSYNKKKINNAIIGVIGYSIYKRKKQES
jgi:hypothetical protein